jgi:hypothetical protein
MEPHERYELLCAMAATGQLDPDDQTDLTLHIETCEACRKTREEFAEVVQELAGEGSRAEESVGIGNRTGNGSGFVEFARSQGLRFSNGAARVLGAQQTHGWSPLRLQYAAALGVLVVGISIGFAVKASADRKAAQMSNPTATHLVEAGAAQTPIPDLSASRKQIAELQSELDGARVREAEIPALKQKVVDSAREHDAVNAVIAQRDSTIQALQATLADGQAKLEGANGTIASLIAKNDQAIAGLTSEREHSTELAEELRNAKEAAEQDRELSAATTEVRALMGARRLFMVDVYDGSDMARANRSFGRVFYSEGKSLIFYAFDLNKIRDPKHVTFEAWAEQDKDPKHARHLGDFYIDDVAQQRWVMKVNDPEKLKAIDAIYVTVESGRGTTRPSGQKLLYAYLGGQPNHP